VADSGFFRENKRFFPAFCGRAVTDVGYFSQIYRRIAQSFIAAFSIPTTIELQRVAQCIEPVRRIEAKRECF
jgi:hypothetical protein